MNHDLANQPVPSHPARVTEASRPGVVRRRAVRALVSGSVATLLAAAACGDPDPSTVPLRGGVASSKGEATAGSGGGAGTGSAKSGTGMAGAANRGGASSGSTAAGSTGLGTTGGTVSRPAAGGAAGNSSSSSGGSLTTGGVSGTTAGAPASGGSFGATGGSSSGGSSFATGGTVAAPSGGSGGSGTTMLGECTPGMKRCDATGKTVQNCGADALWQDTPCQFVCVNDSCGGVCTPGARQCNGSQPERCTDQGTWMTDGSPCPAQCENGTCTGACKNGDTQCTSSQAMQTCSNGQWGATMSCQFACVNDECGGVCAPNSTHCASGTEVETCGQTGQWQDRRACNFVCTGNNCGGECRPNDKRCKNSTQEQVCNAEGRWQDGQTCSFACVNNACGGVCKPNDERCANVSQIQVCSQQGAWQTRDCPNDACVADECATCKPGITRCKSNTTIEECTDAGTWSGKAENCEFACRENQCGGVCKPGTPGTCDPNGEPKGEACDDTGNMDRLTCSANQSCQGGKCGSFPKTLFLSLRNYGGDLGGLSGADSKCNAEAKAANLSGNFKAFLVDSRTPDIRSRFKLEGGPFKLPGGKVVANTWSQLLKGTLAAPINQTQSGTAPIDAVIRPDPADFCDDGRTLTLFWSNVGDDGRLIDRQAHCTNWTTREDDATSSGAHFGNFADTSRRWKDYCSHVGEYCNSGAHILCIQSD